MTEAEVRSQYLAYQPFATSFYIVQVALLANAVADEGRVQQMLENMRDLLDDTIQLLQTNPDIPR